MGVRKRHLKIIEIIGRFFFFVPGFVDSTDGIVNVAGAESYVK